MLVEARLPGGVSGIDLARNASQLRPLIHALVTAGSTDRSITECSNGDRGLQFLPKPYQVADLVRVVGAILKGDTFSVEREALLSEARVTGSHSRREGTGVAGLDNSELASHAVPSRRRSAIRLGVRPFGTSGSDAEGAFSMGLAEEITRAFAPFSWISCVSPSSVAAVTDASPISFQAGRNSIWISCWKEVCEGGATKSALSPA